MLEKGMKVKVRNDLEVGHSYDGVIFCAPMNPFKGKEVTISRHVKIPRFDIYYIEENTIYFWTEDMFEPVGENPMPKLKSGMFIKNELNHYGVIVEGKIIYHHGGYDLLSKVIDRDGYIKQIIEDDYGFNDLKNGKIIWEYKEKEREKEREKEKDRPKTYLEDFIRKYPNAQILSHNIVNVCLQDLGETKFCPMEYGIPSCIECWNAPKGKWNKKEKEKKEGKEKENE